MKFTYMKAPLNKYTFKTKKIREWVECNSEGHVLNLFAGKTFLSIQPRLNYYSEFRNDIDLTMPANMHLDALEFSNIWTGSKFNTILLDPPYSYRKSMELYNGNVASPFKQLKDAIVPILEPGGIVITFGYHSVSMGAGRGFKQEHLLIISHGGAIHDSIAIIERKIENVEND